MTDDNNVFLFSPRQRGRGADDRPDAPHRYIDEEGVEWFQFCVDFEFDGSGWGFEIWAKDFADAEARVASLRENAKLGGQLYASIPAD